MMNVQTRFFDGLSRISRETQNEEAADLEKAELERLHAKALQQRTAVLVRGPRGWQLVQLRRMKEEDRSLLLKRVYAEPEDEQLGFLNKMIARMDRAGVKLSTVTIRFRDLVVEGNQLVKPSGQPKSGLKETLKAINPLAKGRHLRRTNVIDGVSGVLKPGRLILLLGTPGSGKSLLLKALSGMLKKEKTLKVSAAELSYNGEPLEAFVPERTAAYISQLDQHYGELTVRQTLEFAARCQGNMRELLERLLEKERELGIEPDPDLHRQAAASRGACLSAAASWRGGAAFMTASMVGGKTNLRVDIMLRTLGLDICADTLVGNAMLRGISGGQKKRVTAGEMLVGASRVLFADEISTGLDSATTHSIVSSLKAATRLRQNTSVIALLQPTPETLELFDDVLVLSSGKVLYHGPSELVLPFFASQGFACPPKKGAADFLQEVPTLADQHKYWAGEASAYRFISSEQFSDACWSQTEAGKAAAAELAAPFDASVTKDWDEDPLQRQPYGASLSFLARSCLRRGLMLMPIQGKIHLGRLIQMIFMAFVVGTLFLQEPQGLQGPHFRQDGDVAKSLASANYLLGVLFFSCIMFMVGAFADSSMLVEALPVFYKQRTSRFYPPVCFALQMVLMRLPFCFVESWFWTLMVYFLVGFNISARLLAFWGTLFGLAAFTLTLFFCCAALARNVAAASALQAFILLLFGATSGFIINKAKIPGGWNGVYWASPFQWDMSGLAVNEMTSSDWSDPIAPGSPTIGEAALSSRSMHQSYTYVWVAIFAYGVGGTLLNFGMLVLLLTFLDALKDPVVVSEEAYAAQLAARAGLDAVNTPQGGSPVKLEMGKLDGSSGGGTAGGTGTDSAHAGGKHDVESQADHAEHAERAEPGGGGSGLAFRPLVMTFRDVRYSVPFPKNMARPEGGGGGEGPHAGRLLLLKGITGSFRPGVLTALMGASGAGKTTLMDVLADRKTGGTITGEVLCNGFPKDPAAFARMMGYCEQTDIHIPYTTVQEALEFSAALRLPSTTDRATAAAFVQEVMDLVELTPIRNSPVGLPGSGLSVEQRKRLTIGVELVANPSIVFMDEPTSGLDARAASVVMRAVKNTVRTGRAVVCTIHQPSPEIFEAFDELLLLKRGGETIFNGAIGKDSASLIAHFRSYSGLPDIEPGVNPANWMLEVTSGEAEKAGGHDFAELFRRSELAAAADAIMKEQSAPEAGATPVTVADMHPVSPLKQTRVLLLRNSREVLRNMNYNLTRSIVALACAIVFATLFRNQGQSTEDSLGVLNIAGAMYASSVFVGMVFCLMCQDPVGMRRTVFYREHAAGTYGVVPHWFAEFGAEVVWLAGISIIYSIIVYFSIDFITDAGKFFWFTMQIFLNLAVFLAFGMLCVHATPNLQLANATAGMFFALFNLICGFLRPEPAIGSGWIWMYWANPVSYTLYGLVVNQLGDVTSPTLVAGTADTYVPVNEYVRSYFGFKHSFQWWTVAVLIGFVVFFRALALLALKKLNFQSR
ncbi:hypothetical protein ABPG75_003310 [Micractinium tetrahymenae]